MQSVHRLMCVNISMTFHEDILNGFQVIELQSGRHCILVLGKVQRGITKNNIQELWFLCSAYRLMLVNISVTFHDDIFNGFQVTERTALYSVLGIFHERSYANGAIIEHTT